MPPCYVAEPLDHWQPIAASATGHALDQSSRNTGTLPALGDGKPEQHLRRSSVGRVLPNPPGAGPARTAARVAVTEATGPVNLDGVAPTMCPAIENTQRR